jgi:hypothetical protein
MRRTVLTAALRGGSPTDEDLATSLEALLSSSERLTRQLLGGRDASAADQDADDVEEDGDDEDMDADMGAGWSVAPGFPM